jgi:hypothetical protein
MFCHILECYLTQPYRFPYAISKWSLEWKSEKLCLFFLYKKVCLVFIHASFLSCSPYYYLSFSFFLLIFFVFSVQKDCWFQSLTLKFCANTLKGNSLSNWACLSSWSGWRVMWSGVPRAHWTFDLFCWDYWSRLIVSTSLAVGGVVCQCVIPPWVQMRFWLTQNERNWSFCSFPRSEWEI